MASNRVLFMAVLCFVLGSVLTLQYTEGSPKPKSLLRIRNSKMERFRIIKASLGATCKLRCSLKNHNVKVQWLLNNKPIDPKSKDYRFKRRYYKNILIIPQVKNDLGGIYSCVVAGKKRLAYKVIITSDKRVKCRRKRSLEADICKKPTNNKYQYTCQHLNFSKCKSLTGVPTDVHLSDFIYQGKRLTIQIAWNLPREGYDDLWGFETQLTGFHNDANNGKCFQFNDKNRTYMSFTDLIFGAEYEIKLRSLPSDKRIIKRMRTKEKCHFEEFKNRLECCTVVNLNATVLEEEGKVDLRWNVKCAANIAVVNNSFVVQWVKGTDHLSKCSNIHKTSAMNYTIDLPYECGRGNNYTTLVYISGGLSKRGKRIIVHFPSENRISLYSEKPLTDNGSRETNTKVIASVIGIMGGIAVMFVIYKWFVGKNIIKIKLPSRPPTGYEYEQEEENEDTLLPRECRKKVLLMNAQCCEKCTWVVHCLGMLLNSTNLVEARLDLWHVQEIASEVMRWYQMEIRGADCVLVLASNIMTRLYEGEHIPNRESNDLLDIRAQLNLVAGEMSKEPNTPKFISAYFTYNAPYPDVPTFLNSRLTHQLTKDLDRLIFHVLKIEAIQPRRSQPIAVIGGVEFDEKKNDLLRAVTEAEQYHALQNIAVKEN